MTGTNAGTETTETTTQDASEGEAPETTETAQDASEGEAPAASESVQARVMMRRQQKDLRRAQRERESATAALAEAKALREAVAADLEIVKRFREAPDEISRARALGLDLSRLAEQAVAEDTPEHRAALAARRELEAYEQRQREAAAAQSQARREHAEADFVREATRNETIGALLRAEDGDGEPLLSRSELLAQARRLGEAIQRKRLADTGDGRVSDAEIIEALSARYAKRFASPSSTPAASGKPPIKPLSSAVSARARQADNEDEYADPREHLRALSARRRATG